MSMTELLSIPLALGLAGTSNRPDLPASHRPDTCVAPGGAPTCRDTDRDGLCDAWENSKRLPSGEPLPDADPHRPDIYLQYDYMGWGEAGSACSLDSDCTQGGLQPNLVCHDGRCNHNHQPDPRALQIVVDSFARHGVALHLDPTAREIPHSDVITFAHASDADDGPKAKCSGADLESGRLGGFAVSFADVKARYFDPKRAAAYHYAVSGHLNTCLTDDEHAPIGNCGSCPADRATPRGLPKAGTSGTAELPGNDFIVSLGLSFFNPVGSAARSPITEAGVLMHELGHNLGLHHAGDWHSPQDAPNYLSVMNTRYVFGGILQSTGPGSSELAPCAADVECSGGAVCRQLPFGGGRCTRVDYSTSVLGTLVEASLDEAAGVSSLDSGLKDIVLYTDASGTNRRGAAAGTVDWNGDGAIDAVPVSVDVNFWLGATETLPGYDDWDHGTCRVDSDCRVNRIRQEIHELLEPSLDPHEPCVQNKCQSLWYAFQCTPWGRKD